MDRTTQRALIYGGGTVPKNVRGSVVVLLLAALTALAGCSGGSSGTPAGNAKSNPAATTGTSARPAVSSSPTEQPAPTGLPTVASEDQVGDATKQLVAIAARYAIGVDNADRHPAVQEGGEYICDVKVDADVCTPTAKDSDLTIWYLSHTTWVNYTQNNSAGGPAVWQRTVLGTYIAYLDFRYVVTHNDFTIMTQPQPWFALDTCKAGNVLGGLDSRGLLSPELKQAFGTSLFTKPDYIRGTKGSC